MWHNFFGTFYNPRQRISNLTSSTSSVFGFIDVFSTLLIELTLSTSKRSSRPVEQTSQREYSSRILSQLIDITMFSIVTHRIWVPSPFLTIFFSVPSLLEYTLESMSGFPFNLSCHVRSRLISIDWYGSLRIYFFEIQTTNRTRVPIHISEPCDTFLLSERVLERYLIPPRWSVECQNLESHRFVRSPVTSVFRCLSASVLVSLSRQIYDPIPYQ